MFDLLYFKCPIALMCSLPWLLGDNKIICIHLLIQLLVRK